LTDVITTFIAETEPFEWSIEDARARLQRGPK
jgi:hypothetical protein